MLTGPLALAAAGLFTGAALYVNLAEHPARRALDPVAQLIEWQLSYKHASVMQGGLTLLGFTLGLAAWLGSGAPGWLTGALLLLAAWPYTLLVIMPVNRRLKAAAPDAADAGTGTRIDRWNRLHMGRTALGLAATIAFLWAIAG